MFIFIFNVILSPMQYLVILYGKNFDSKKFGKFAESLPIRQSFFANFPVFVT